MGFSWFQIACVPVLGLAYALAFLREPRRRALARDLALLGLAAWLGEETCIRLYRFYGYAPGWWPMVGHVPLLVVAIWPMVVWSARSVALELWPEERVLGRALRIAVIVCFDASLMEAVAVARGLWSWAEPGYLEVPLIGLLGWGIFAFAASLWLDTVRGRLRYALPLAAALATHALLLVAWWGGLRWWPRGDLGAFAVPGFALIAVLLALTVAAVRGERRLAWGTVSARVVASSVFFALLATLWGHARFGALLVHTGLVSLPYVLAVPTFRRPRQAGPNRR